MNRFKTFLVRSIFFGYDSNFFGRFKPVSYHSKRFRTIQTFLYYSKPFRTIQNLSVQVVLYNSKPYSYQSSIFRRSDLFENNFEIFIYDEFLIVYFMKISKKFHKNNKRISFEANQTVKLSQSLDRFSDLSN